MTTSKTDKVKAGVIGWPISHSLSPRLHGFWLEQLGINGEYLPIAVAPEDLEKTLRSLPENGFAGVNVTVPHKEAALTIVDELTETAARIGAVNTIVCANDGSLKGDNTDAFGFINNIYDSVPSWKPGTRPALVLGAGGASRAVISALMDAGVPEIRLCNRTRTRADELAAHFGNPVKVVEWDNRRAGCADTGLLVNTTTLGMVGKPALDIDLGLLPSDAIVNDIVYTPLHTHLLDQAQNQGCQIVDGLGMLLHQARPGFEAWFGLRPDVTDELRIHVLSGVGQ